MPQTHNPDNQCIIDLLTTLQEERFRPGAWWRFLLCSWEMSCATAAAYPTLKRSWLRVTFLMSLLSLSILLVTGVLEGS
jgi:hypothetical protein